MDRNMEVPLVFSTKIQMSGAICESLLLHYILEEYEVHRSMYHWNKLNLSMKNLPNPRVLLSLARKLPRHCHHKHVHNIRNPKCEAIL